MSKNIPQTADADALFEAFLGLETVDDCYALFDDLCTVAEIHAMIQRFAVARMLAKDMTYAEIEKKTGASTATISRINKCLLHGEGGYRKAIAERSEDKTGE